MTLEHILGKLDAFQAFAEQYRENGGGMQLGNHQLVPIFDAVENGLRRFLLAYGTGAGKTVVPLEVIKHLQRKGEHPKVLMIAPNQTITEFRNDNVLGKHGCNVHTHYINKPEDAFIPADKDFVVINYEKLQKRLQYFPHLLQYARKASMFIVDEAHNIKARTGKISQGYQELIEMNPRARLVALTASPIPDRLKDAGMMLFTLDPVRYEHLKRLPFIHDKDPEALWETREKGFIRFFDFEAVARFHHLPLFQEHLPQEVTMPVDFIEPYMSAYKEAFHLGKAVSLERIAIEAMLQSEDTKDFLRDRLRKGHTLNFFSHLIHEPKQGTPDEALFRKLESLLRNLGAKNVATINGATLEKKRLEIQKAMREGCLDALINQWDCTSEGFCESAGNRPVTIIPLRSPYSPGRFIQIIGRSYRPGQFAPVEYIELHAHSGTLIKKIDDFVERYAREHKLRKKATWNPTLYHRDAYMIRKGKEREIMALFLQRSYELLDPDKHDVDSTMSYGHRLSHKRTLDYSDKKEAGFGGGTRRVTRFTGKNYEEGLKEHIEPLAEDYYRPDVLRFAAGKINLFLAEAVERIKEKEGQNRESWRIADLGCCSGAVFSQARLLYQTLLSLKHEMPFDQIMNVDGHAGVLRSAKKILEERAWFDGIPEKIRGFSEEDLIRAKEHLRDHDYMGGISFQAANFTRDHFGKFYDLIITSQCLQYNDQEHDRDIEKIVRNVNFSLRENGHYLAVLTGNDRKKSYTLPKDVENFTKVLHDYGFQVLKYDQISGRSEKKEVLRPFHFFHTLKIKEAPSELVPGDVPLIYSDTLEHLAGGYKDKRIRQSTVKTEPETSPMPDEYVGDKNKKFEF